MNEENLNEESLRDEQSTDRSDIKSEQVMPPVLKLQISADKMRAELEIYLNAKDQTVSYEEVIAFLTEKEVTYGILHDEIKQYCADNTYDNRFCVAKGLFPEKGKDAEIYHYFESNRELKAKERADGTIDFKDLDCVQNVDKEQVLSYKVMPTEGIQGYDVFGQIIKPFPGKDISFLCGDNTSISGDGTQLLSTIDGYVEIMNNRVTVKNLFTVKEDVDNSVGNLNVLGSLVIRGDVREGFTVKAKGDIAIRGMAEGAMVESDGNISIAEGMKGMNCGKIICKGDIHCKFIENARVECEGDVHADTIINCTIIAKGSIILKSSKSSIRGGVYQAGTMIYAGDIGTQKNIPTVLSIASEEMNEALKGDIPVKEPEEVKALKNKLGLIEKELENIEKALRQLFTAEDIPDKKTMIRTLLPKKNQLTEVARQIRSNLEELQAEKQKNKKSLTDFKIVALGTIYPGVRINIAVYRFSVDEQYQHTKFIVEEGYVVPVLLNPGDKL